MNTPLFLCLALLTPATLAGGPTLVIQEGDPAPGTPGDLVRSLGAPFTNGLGQVGFTGSLEGEDGIEHFVWFDDGVVWRSSDGAPFTLSGAESTMGISDDGDFIYSPSTDGDDSVWTSAGLLLREPDPAPGFPGQFISFTSRPQMTAGGAATFIGGVSTVMGGSTSTRVLFRVGDERPEPVFATGDAVGKFTIDTPSGVDFDYHFSDNGRHHIHVLVMDAPSTADAFIYVDGRLVARESEPTGDGDLWSAFDNVSINDAGDYLFTGNTDGAIGPDEFIAHNGVIVLREGTDVDGVPLTGGSLRAVSLNNLGQAVHLWGVTSGDEYLFIGTASDLAATSTRLLGTGDEIDTDGDGTPDAEVVDFNASGVIGPGLSLAEDGRVFVEVDLLPLEGGEEREAILRLDIGTRCPADLDSSGDVGFTDLVSVLAAWGPCAGCPQDFDEDGIVGFTDLLTVLASWGPCRG
ncbi:MAG: hypothetical protein KJO43_13210 [Phycisphaerae bacterium]|nr:hypothetical protein [Phycisphaerae bacterium]